MGRCDEPLHRHRLVAGGDPADRQREVGHGVEVQLDLGGDGGPALGPRLGQDELLARPVLGVQGGHLVGVVGVPGGEQVVGDPLDVAMLHVSEARAAD